jgi:putative serine/threonine protein kinase
LKPTITIPVNALIEEPYASVICYPRSNPAMIQKRIDELQQLGVKALEFVGKTSASNVPILGKGYVGVVVIAHVRGQRAALKMRRIDSDRVSLEREAELLVRANKVSVGPKFLAASKDFLLMQLVDGDLFEDWLQIHEDREPIRKVLVDILEQCWRLDEASLDHGELSRAPKHLLVDRTEKAFIVDFETASVERKVINVTSVCQFLFMGNSQAVKTLVKVFGEKNRSELVSALKSYKKNRNRRNFKGLLEVCLS